MKKPKPKHRKKRKTRVVKEKKYILGRHCQCTTRKCSLCGKKFASTQALNIHVKDEHEYKFLCKFRKCRSEYSSQTSADRHIRHHSPPRYQCEHWNRQFINCKIWQSFIRVHWCMNRNLCCIIICTGYFLCFIFTFRAILILLGMSGFLMTYLFR